MVIPYPAFRQGILYFKIPCLTDVGIVYPQRLQSYRVSISNNYPS